MNFPSFLIFFLLSVTCGSEAKAPCCASKTVGDHNYTLVADKGDVPEVCINSCAYSRDDNPNSRYCFAAGELEGTCNVDGASIEGHNDDNAETRQGVLITGGSIPVQGVLDSVEMYPGSAPRLGLEGRTSHTVNILSNNAIVCGGKPARDWTVCNWGQCGYYFTYCDRMTSVGWQSFAPCGERWYHTGHTLGDRILLVGGYKSPKTSEYITKDGRNYTGPSIDPERERHCGVTINDDTIVLIGGWKIVSEKSVVEMTGFRQQNVSTKHLPNLNVGRYEAACGMYVKDNKMMLIVVGGYLTGDIWDSTEILEYPGGTSWELVPGGEWPNIGGNLPYPGKRYAFSGVTVNNQFAVIGGWTGREALADIVTWDMTAKAWNWTGSLITGRISHAVTAFDIGSLNY